MRGEAGTKAPPAEKGALPSPRFDSQVASLQWMRPPGALLASHVSETECERYSCVRGPREVTMSVGQMKGEHRRCASLQREFTTKILETRHTSADEEMATSLIFLDVKYG
ncbi:hypothetical protein MRX96_012011 [Rhipicephalus microplus]